LVRTQALIYAAGRPIVVAHLPVAAWRARSVSARPVKRQHAVCRTATARCKNKAAACSIACSRGTVAGRTLLLPASVAHDRGDLLRRAAQHLALCVHIVLLPAPEAAVAEVQGHAVGGSRGTARRQRGRDREQGGRELRSRARPPSCSTVRTTSWLSWRCCVAYSASQASLASTDSSRQKRVCC